MRILLPLLTICIIATAAAAAGARAGGGGADAAAPVGKSFELLDEAHRAWRDRDYAALEPAIEPIVRENPYNGKFWYVLGDAKYYQKKYAEGAEAYMRAGELGWRPGNSFYNAGCCYALSGDGEEAIDAVVVAIRGGLQNRERLIREDSDLDSIRDSAAFRKRILPVVPEDVSRAEGWAIDLDYMHRRMEETHWDLYANISREEWTRSLDRIRGNIASMSDDDVIVDLMALFARIGDGHTGVVPPIEEGTWHALPVDFYVFADGVYVRMAAGRYAGAVGKRVVRVGNVTVEEALERCATVTQRDNSQQIKWIAPRYLTVMQVLKRLGIAGDVAGVDLVLEDEDGARETVRVESVPFDHRAFSRRFDGVVTMRDDAPGPKPLWAKYADRGESHYDFEHLPDEDMVYFYFDSVRDNDEGESLEEFAARMFEFIDANDVGALVIDVRHNHGGNNYLIKPVIDGIIRSERIGDPGSLFVIIGRETFSACQNFVNRLEREAEPWFVGEPTGSRPNFVGEDNRIVLPYSGLSVRGSSRYWQDSISEDTRPWIAPHLVAEMTSRDYASNHDPAMEVIRAYRAHHVARAADMGSRE